MNQKLEHETAGAYGRLLSEWPTWVLVGLFLAIAVCMASAGILDDWLRAVLALCFAGIALTLAIRGMHSLAGRSGGPPPTVSDPPPSPNEAS